MRALFAICAWLACCGCLASDASQPPTGEELFDLIIKNAKLPLRTEPLCNLSSATRSGELTLGQHFSTVLASSFATQNKVSLKSECTASKYETRDGYVRDGWECRVEMNESKGREFISSATIAFAVSADRSKLIAGSIRCL